MPNFDGGHYFYTGLFPVSRGPVKRKDDSVTVPSHLLRETLASLPNFSQVRESDDATRKTDRISPFARCRSTHFARLVVIDDPAFNGRNPIDALVNIVKGLFGKGLDLLAHQPVDHLGRAWLLFAADFDAADADARDRWAAGLWDVMEKELREIFGHCRAFNNVNSREAFAAYLARGQLETTMSFNDYWIDPMTVPSLSIKTVGLASAAVLLVIVGLAWLARRELELNLGWPYWVGAGLIGVAAALWTAYKIVMRRGAKPFPPAANSDLKSVLKGLHLQQRLIRFAIAQQGAPAQQIYDEFAVFLKEARPDDLEHPTQAPGVLPS